VSSPHESNRERGTINQLIVNSMSFLVIRGKTKEVQLPVTPSTAITAGTLVTLSSGKLVAVTSGTAAVDIAGILKATIASTDSDYATDRLVAVLVPTSKHVVYEADVTSGLVAADVGLEVDLTDGNTVNRGATSVKAVKVVRVISTTKGHFYVKVNGSY
jgi:hypothetical protein